jgi:hypothetical protein
MALLQIRLQPPQVHDQLVHALQRPVLAPQRHLHARLRHVQLHGGQVGLPLVHLALALEHAPR